MALLSKMLKGKAVYWAPKDPDAFGNPQYEAPIQIRCRWEGNTRQIKNYKNEDVVSMARVYVDRDVLPGGVLWEGQLIHLTSQTKPFENMLAQEIQAFNKIPTLKYTKALREARL